MWLFVFWHMYARISAPYAHIECWLYNLFLQYSYHIWSVMAVKNVYSLVMVDASGFMYGTYVDTSFISVCWIFGIYSQFGSCFLCGIYLVITCEIGITISCVFSIILQKCWVYIWIKHNGCLTNIAIWQSYFFRDIC